MHSSSINKMAIVPKQNKAYHVYRYGHTTKSFIKESCIVRGWVPGYTMDGYMSDVSRTISELDVLTLDTS